MKTKTPDKAFELGRLVATPQALDLLEQIGGSVHELVSRHAFCDWSQMSPADQEANREALTTGARIFSAYQINGHDFWVITEWDRSVTTLLLPENY